MKKAGPINDNKTSRDIDDAMAELEKAYNQIFDNLKQNPQNKPVYEKSITAVLEAKKIIEKMKEHYGLDKYYPIKQGDE
ncbi:hypothetical protein [Kiloniella majae]|uniref:hypothetical protein n=1 Tax=Kiloniella majae TaxID=1938558 RepID=UPI000A27858A|nr:hypothetical protein [Kiloniella majae]